MKLPALHRFGKFLTAERLAVAVFLAVALGLWWGMQSRPEMVITLRMDSPDSECLLSPDGTLCLVHEWRKFMVSGIGGAPADLWQGRLRVFDLTTGQKVWHWENSRESIRQITWTGRNHLYFFLPTIEETTRTGLQALHQLGGRILGFDPRPGKGRVFDFHCPDSRAVQICFTPEGNTLMIGQSLNNGTTLLEQVDLRTGLTNPFLTKHNGPWVMPRLFSPDGAKVLSTQERDDKTLLLLHDVISGKLLHQFSSNCQYLEDKHLTFSPDGRLLVFCDSHAGRHDLVRVGDVESGELLATLEGFRHQISVFRRDSPRRSFTDVVQCRFSPDSSRLCIGTGLWWLASPLNGEWHARTALDSQAHLFETRTFQRLKVLDQSRYPLFSQDTRFLFAPIHDAEEGTRILVYVLQTGQEHVYLLEAEKGFLDAGLVQAGDGQELYYLCQAKAVEVSNWMQKAWQWLRWKPAKGQQFEVTFRDLTTGQQLYHWTFVAEHMQMTPIPQRHRLLLHFSLGNGQHRLELYSLPPRRPWFHILGWALVAGVSVELLGLWRRWRRKKVVEEGTVPMDAKPT